LTSACLRRYLKSVATVIQVIPVATPKRTAQAKDVLETAPGIYTAVFENDSVRVLKAKMLPGEKVDGYYHPNYLIYVIRPSVIRIVDETAENLHPCAGDVMWMEAGYHSCENVGKAVFEALLVEVK